VVQEVKINRPNLSEKTGAMKKLIGFIIAAAAVAITLYVVISLLKNDD